MHQYDNFITIKLTNLQYIDDDRIDIVSFDVIEDDLVSFY